MLIFYALIALLAAVAGAFIALWLQSLIQKKQEEQRQIWQHAQENHLQGWASQQEKRVADLEARLTTRFQQLQQAWKQWVTQDTIQATALSQEYQAAITQLKVDHELLRVMRVEETPLTTNSNGQQQPAFSNWRPVTLQGADLRRRDLSHRYLGYANLCEAQLSGATFFMANLSGANLAKANLVGADLSGVDFSGADLRDAILSNTNLLVADLHKANLTGANLLGAKGLTPEQIHSAIYDSTTLFDTDFDSTPTRHRITNTGKSAVADSTQAPIEAVPPVQSSPTTAPAPGEAPASKLETPAPEVEEATADTPTPAPKLETPAPEVEEATADTPTPAPKLETPAPTVEAAPVTLAEPEELPRGSDLSAEQAPSEPELETPAAPSEPVAVAATTATPEISNALPEVEVTPSEPLESPDLSAPQAATDTSPEASQEPGAAASETIIPEAAAPVASPETTETNDTLFAQEDMDMLPLSFLPDMTSFIQHLDEPAPVPPLTSEDSLLDPAVADLLAHKQDNTHTGEFDTATPNPKNSVKRAAKEDKLTSS